MDHILPPELAPFSDPRHYDQQAAMPLDPRVLETLLAWLAER